MNRRGADPCLGFEATSAAAAARLSVTECRRFATFGLAARFMRDQSGVYAIMFGLLAPIFLGTLALGTETGLWYSTQEKMQGAADSSAISAAVGLIAGNTNVTLQANAAAASDGFVNGSSGTVVTVNQPPLSGPNTGTKGVIEVIIKQPQKLLFSSLFLKSPVVVQARAVAGPTPSPVCVLALSKILPLVPGITTALSTVLADHCIIADNSTSPLALTVAAFAKITAQKINVVGGVVDLLATVTPTPITGAAATADPFAGTTVPPISGLPCQPDSFSIHGNITGTVTLLPGRYCGGITVIGGGIVTLSPGTYYMDGLPGFAVIGGSVTGTGVTIVLTSNLLSLWATVNLGGGVINLTAPSSGPYADLVVFADPRMLLPAPGLIFSGGPAVNFIGTIYAPSAIVTYALGSATTPAPCTRLIADTIAFAAGSSGFSKCAVTLGPSSGAPASLLE